MNTKYTPAPWFADENGMIWRRNPSDLYQNGGGVAGDKPIATAHIGWVGEDLTGYPIKANSQLIAAAPELLEALQVLLIDAKALTSASLYFKESIPLATKAIVKALGETM